MGKLKNPLNRLNFTQFLSAFSDSVIIIVIVQMLKQTLHTVDEHNPYLFLVESFFLFSYVLFAPFVGTFADRNFKNKVLLTGNIIKAIGIILLLVGISPALCYGVVGLGAAVYGPAKYGILIELTETDHELLQANGKLESFTILAIIFGTVVGGAISDYSALFGKVFCLITYAVSILITFGIPAKEMKPELLYGKEAKLFFQDVKHALGHAKMRYALIGSGSFWMISVVIKNGLFLWIPDHLGIEKGFGQSLVVGMTAIGIVIGALLARKFSSMKYFYKSAVYGLVASLIVIIFPWISGNHIAVEMIVCLLLLFIGLFAGMFIIPLNAVLQHEGHEELGVGKTIAVQNLGDNSMMLIGSFSVYLLNGHYGFSVTASMFIFGLIFLGLILYLLSQRRKVDKPNPTLP